MSADITPTEGLPLPTEQCRVPRPGDTSMRCVRFKAHTGDHGNAGVFWRNESSTGRPSDITTHDSPLVDHARYELERAGFFGADSDYGGMLGESVMQIVRTHAAQRHSGASHHLALGLATALLGFKPLTPLTDDPTEWMEVGDNLWQNRRDSEAFSYDGGKTYTLLSERRRWVRTITPWPVYKHLPRWVKDRVRRSERSGS